MAKIVGRKPIEIKISALQNGYIPVFDSSSRLWTTIDKEDLTSGSAVTSGSNIFIGDQTISGSVIISGSLEVNGRNYINDSSSFESRIITNSASFASFSGSYINESASFVDRIRVNSSSFASFSGSYVNESSSFADRIRVNSSSFASFSGSYINESSSFASRITTNSSSISILSGSYLASSASFDTKISNNSGSIAQLSGSYVSDSSSFASRITTNSASISSISASFTAFSGSYSTGSFTGSFTGSIIGLLTGTASYATQALTASNANTASSADNFTVRGTLTAQTLIAQTITSSIEFITGSTRNGSLLSNTHQFTGSVGITGSLTVNGSDYITTSGSTSTRLTDLESFSGVYSTGSFTGSFIGSHTGSFSGSLYNLQNNVLGHIPFYSSSQVLADSIMRQLDNGTGSFSIVINQDNITTSAPEALYVWQPSDTSYNVIAGKGNLNSYLQLNIQNLNTGENASSDVVATANNGNETSNYIDMGINSEGFTGSIGDANDAYIYSTGNHLHIGNASNQYVGFFAGGFDVDTNMKLLLDPSNLHQLTGSLDVSGSVVARSFTGSLQGTASWANNAINATSASYTLTSSYAAQALSASYWSGSIINAATASYVLNAVSSSFASTASYVLNAVSASFTTLAQTASFVQTAQTASYVLNAISSSFASTASSVNRLNQNVVISGSLTVTGSTNIIGNSGTTLLSSNADTLVFTGSLLTSGSIVSTGSLSILGGVTGSLLGTASYATQALSASYWSGSIINAATASYVLNAVSSSYATSALTASNANTASSADNFLVRGTLTAQTINVQTITSSVDFVTGSSVNGSLLTNTHQFTGSVSITGSLAVNGVDYNSTSASFDTRILNNSGSIAQLSGSYLASSASFDTRILNNSASIAQLSGSYLASSASFDSRINIISSSYATTGSNIFVGNQTITGSLLVSGSTVQIGNNTLTGNTTLSGSIAISGSQTFTGVATQIGNSYFTGSMNISGSTTQVGNNSLFGNTTISGSIIISGSHELNNPSIKLYGDTETDGAIKFLPVADTIDPTISGSYIYVSGSTNDLYFTQNGNGYANTTRLRWLEGNLYTGLLNGGLITAATGSTTFNVSSGSGIIVNLNASLSTNPYPTIQYVNWGNLTNQPLTYLTSSIQTFIGINSSGTVVQQTNAFSDGQYNTIITIGTVLHQNKSTVNASITYPNVAYGYKQRTYDFLKAFGPLKLSGLFIYTSGSLGLTVGSGTAFADGRNYQVDPNNPSYITDTGTTVSKIFRYYQSGSAFVQDTNNGAGYTVIDPANYNNNGTLTGVSPSTPWTIQRVFWYPNSATKGIVVYYGNQQYASSTEAISNVPYEQFEEVENTKQNAVYLGAIVIKYNGSFLTPGDYSILTAGLFRGVGGSGGGGGSITSRLVDLSDVAISGPTNGQPLIYNTTAEKWINQSFISASISGNAVTATSASHAIVAISASYFSGSVSNAISSSYSSTASYVQNAQTASFAVTASYLLGQSPTASYALTASYVENAKSASYWSGSVINAQTASYAVTASYLLGQPPTASHALTASYINPLTQDLSVTGSINVGGGGKLIVSAVGGEEGGEILLGKPETNTTLTGSGVTIDLYQNRIRFFEQGGSARGAYLDISTLGTGVSTNLLGTATSAISSSYAATASFVQTAQTASYVLNAISASYAATAPYSGLQGTVPTWNQDTTGTAATASYVLNAVSASRAATSSISSQASTVSISGISIDKEYTLPLILTGSSGPSLGLSVDLSPGILYNPSSNLFRSTNIVATGSLLGTSSFADNATTASYVLNAVSSSFSTLSETANTASFVQTSQTASYVETAQTASFAQTAQTASYVLNAVNALFAATTSFANNLTVAGTLTAQTINVQTITSSIEFNTGSTRNGTLLTNTHQFTGSIYSTGSNTFIGTQIISGSIGLQRENYIQSEIVGTGTANIIGLDNGYQVVIGSNGVDAIVANNRIKGANGSVGAPSFTFDDSNTGLYRIGEDDLGVTAGGTLQISINTQSSSFYSPVKALAGFTGSLQGTATTASYALNAVSSSYALSSLNAATASYSNDFTVANTLIIDQTLTDYHTVPSSAAGENNMFNRVTGSYSAGFFKYTVTNGANARTGEVMAIWNGGSIQYTDNSTLDIGDTSGVTAAAVIVSNSVQFNLTTATSGWKLKSLATFM